MGSSLALQHLSLKNVLMQDLTPNSPWRIWTLSLKILVHGALKVGFIMVKQIQSYMGKPIVQK